MTVADIIRNVESNIVDTITRAGNLIISHRTKIKLQEHTQKISMAMSFSNRHNTLGNSKLSPQKAQENYQKITVIIMNRLLTYLQENWELLGSEPSKVETRIRNITDHLRQNIPLN